VSQLLILCKKNNAIQPRF